MFTFSRCLKFWGGNVFLRYNILGFELLVLIFWCDRWVLAISCWFIWYINCVWGTFCVNSGEKPDDPHWICGKGHWPSSVCHLRDRASREGITDDTRAMEHKLCAWGSIVCVLALLSPQLRATTFGLWWCVVGQRGGKEWQHLWESEREKSRVTLTAERSSVWRLSDRLSVARPRKTSTYLSNNTQVAELIVKMRRKQRQNTILSFYPNMIRFAWHFPQKDPFIWVQQLVRSA